MKREVRLSSQHESLGAGEVDRKQLRREKKRNVSVLGKTMESEPDLTEGTGKRLDIR